MSVKASSNDGTPGSFLTTEEAGLIEMSNLDMHERFLCRLTVIISYLPSITTPLFSCSGFEFSRNHVSTAITVVD
jgi:hypothetical protein